MDKHSCTIIIDTNQFLGDFTLSMIRWKNLLQYLNKTHACLQMPTIIWEEIARNYRENFERHLAKTKAAIEKYNCHVNFRAPRFNYYGYGHQSHQLQLREPHFTPREMTDRYMSFLKDSLRLDHKDFLQWDEKWMLDIVHRAIEHRKPFAQETDKGFKDTLIWKTILSLSNKPGFKEAPIVFISTNTHDFENRACPGAINDQLDKEARSHGLTVHYFENLDLFFEKWAAEALNIDFRAIRRGIPDALIKDALKNHIKPYVPDREPAEKDTFITGMSFKVTVDESGRRIVQMSISGFIKNAIDLTNNARDLTNYLDFTAEAVFEQGEEGGKVKVDSFAISIPYTRYDR